jgi:hypothetical protein
MKIVYCGGCNPQVDRTAIAAALADDPDAAAATVYLSGCPRSCASGHSLAINELAVVVAGELVDGVPTPARELAPAVTRKLKE